MRILLINQCFYPDVAATAQHGWDLALHLVAEGHSVTAIASRSFYGESGATLPAREVVDGVEIIRVGRSAFGKTSTVGRACDFIWFFFAAMFAAVRLPRQDVAVCFTTPPFIGMVGVVLRSIRGTRVVTWLMDIYPDVPAALGMLDRRSATYRLLDVLGSWLLRRSDAVVVLGRCMRELVRQKGVPSSVVHLIPPWSPDNPVLRSRDLTNAFRVQWSTGNRVLFMYSGNFGLGHDFATIAPAFRHTTPEGGMQFAMVGGGRRKAELARALASETAAGTVVSAPYQARERLLDLLGAADVHVVSLAAGCEGLMVPSKFYGILGVGRPVIYVGSPQGEVARVISEHECGMVVAPGDVSALSEAIRRFRDSAALRQDAGRRSYEAATARYGRDKALSDWTALMCLLERNQ